MAKYTEASAALAVRREWMSEMGVLDDGISHHCEHDPPVSVRAELAEYAAVLRIQARNELAAANAEIERLRADVEDARVYITTDDGSKLHIRNLLRCGMRSLKRKRGAFWANVADAFGVGSTSAHRLCRFVLLDPDTGKQTEDHPHD